MSTTSFKIALSSPSPSPTPLNPHFQRVRTRTRRSASATADKSRSDSGELHIVNTATTTEQHRRRRNRQHRRGRNQSSIHLSIPPIQDRQSSLYSRPLNALPTYDWSKSCSDLHSIVPLLPNSAGSTTNTSFGSNLDQSNSGSHSPSHSPSSSEDINTIKWCQSTLDLSTITDDWIFELDDYDSGKNSIYTSTEEDRSFLSSTTTFKSLNNNRSVTFIEPARPVPSRNWTKTLDKFSKKLRIPKSHSHEMSSPAPIVPPRSALRKPSQTHLEIALSRPTVTERDSSLYVLDVGAPLSQTPSHSSGSDYEEVDHATSRIASSMARRSIVEENGVFGKKRIVTDRDPHKIRDGLGPKESPSGVYTPPTFPGACGPRPAQYPTHVYTPTNFQLYQSAGPSRSCSTSSSEGDLPQTPISPTLRLFSNKTMAGIRRISGSLASFDPRSSPTPTSNRDSYFSYSSTSSRQSSWGPISPNSANFPFSAGLGVGLAEKDGLTGKGESPPMTRRPTEEPKIKRKPVPSAEDEDDSELVDGIKRVSITHAL